LKRISSRRRTPLRDRRKKRRRRTNGSCRSRPKLRRVFISPSITDTKASTCPCHSIRPRNCWVLHPRQQPQCQLPIQQNQASQAEGAGRRCRRASRIRCTRRRTSTCRSIHTRTFMWRRIITTDMLAWSRTMDLRSLGRDPMVVVWEDGVGSRVMGRITISEM